MNLNAKKSNFNKLPAIKVPDHPCFTGWKPMAAELTRAIAMLNKKKTITVIELYPGVFIEDIVSALSKYMKIDHCFYSASAFRPEQEIRTMVKHHVGEDPVFGILSYLRIRDYYDSQHLQKLKTRIDQITSGHILIIGTGASCLCDADLLIYADLARWEIQQRQRRHEISNLGVSNKEDKAALKYKWAFFVDWRVADRLKRQVMSKWDYVLDTNDRHKPKMISGQALIDGLQKATRQPFELVPYFDPGPWGGQWMKEVCDLDRQAENYAWCFNCVPEENSLLLDFNGILFEIPALDLVFRYPRQLLGEQVFARFGAEFPIRFDFLDTMDGGNLSLQVHPLTDYIHNTFGWSYTQDESYYLMDARADAGVYLGLKDNIDKAQMIKELAAAIRSDGTFNAEKYVQRWPVKKHDHILIPAGTVHCSGKNSMVLEISSTPYIFTFKLWDWGRMGLDGEPRPLHIDHGKNVIQFDRVAAWTRINLINRIELVSENDSWREERTGLHSLEFIETRRHWFSGKVLHDTNGTVNVLNLVEGREVIVESPQDMFEPFVVHYAETFIVPAAVGLYTIRPFGESEGCRCATIKAFVRSC